jgi:hypothetical protein
MTTERDQFDLFADSRDVALRNDLAAALLQGDVGGARAVAAELAIEYGGDPVLASAAELIAFIDAQLRLPQAAHFDAEQVIAARIELTQQLAPAALAVLGADDAHAWMAAQWRCLAQRAAAVEWHADRADAHAAAAYVEAGAWSEAAAAVERIVSWRRIPQPLAWMTLARWHLQGADAGWPLLAEVLWLAPQRARALIEHLPDASLQRLARRFDEDFEPTTVADWAWLPAWALIEQPLLAAVLQAAQPGSETAPAQAFDVMQALLRLERQGRHHDVIEHRRRLQALSAPLFAAYMRTR